MDYGFNRRECENNNKCMLYKIVLCYFVDRRGGDVGGGGRCGCLVLLEGCKHNFVPFVFSDLYFVY